jgi:hypothetical protein
MFLTDIFLSMLIRSFVEVHIIFLVSEIRSWAALQRKMGRIAKENGLHCKGKWVAFCQQLLQMKQASLC